MYLLSSVWSGIKTHRYVLQAPPTPYYTPGNSPSMIMSNDTSSPSSNSSDLWTSTLGGSPATTAFISSTPPTSTSPPSEAVDGSASSTKQRPRYAGVQGTTPSPTSSSQQDTVHPSSRARIASNRQARRKNNGPPRPPNSFMLYRSHFLQNLKIPKDVECRQQNLSRIAAELWRSFSEGERNFWKEKARERARLHLLENPGYVYQPVPKPKKTKDVGGKNPQEMAVELVRQYYPEYEGPTKAPTPPKRKADSSSPRKKRRAADAILPPSLPPSRPASAIAQPGKYPTLGRISPEFRSLPTTPSIRPSSHTASAMDYATMSNVSSPLIHSSLRLPPRALQSNGHERYVSRISTPEKTDTEAVRLDCSPILAKCRLITSTSSFPDSRVGQLRLHVFGSSPL